MVASSGATGDGRGPGWSMLTNQPALANNVSHWDLSGGEGRWGPFRAQAALGQVFSFSPGPRSAATFATVS